MACDREQSFLLPPDVRDWLPEGHLACRRDRIERACVEDVACRVVAAHQPPDHAMIARFVERHEVALDELFGEVLTLCAQAGMVTVGVIAIDGTKIAANANRDRTLTYTQLASAIVEEQIATDQAETAALGDRCGDELPPVVAGRQGRRGWLRGAAQQLDRDRAEQARPIPGPRPDRLLGGKRRLEEEHAVERRAHESYEAYRAVGRDKSGRRLSRPPDPFEMPATPQGKINTSDPDSKLVHGMRGWVQGYNAQAVCNEQHLILAAEVMTASPDFGHLGPMVAATQAELARAGVDEAPEVVVVDAGYWHLEQMNEITGQGIPVLVPPDSSRRQNTRPGWDGGAYDFMRSVLATEHGSELYRQRKQLIEPIFGHTKHNRGFTRFARRGRSAARTEWRLIAATHNLTKLHKHLAATG